MNNDGEPDDDGQTLWHEDVGDGASVSRPGGIARSGRDDFDERFA